MGESDTDLIKRMGQIQILEIRSGSKPVAAVCRWTVPILLRRRLSQAALGDLLCRSRRIRIAGEWRNACSGGKCRRRPICRGIYTKEAILRSLLIRLSALFREPAGARTQDPNIKSVVLYLLSYGFSVGQRKMLSVLVVQMYGLFLFYQNKTIFLYSLK